MRRDATSAAILVSFLLAFRNNRIATANGTTSRLVQCNFTVERSSARRLAFREAQKQSLDKSVATGLDVNRLTVRSRDRGWGEEETKARWERRSGLEGSGRSPGLSFQVYARLALNYSTTRAVNVGILSNRLDMLPYDNIRDVGTFHVRNAIAKKFSAHFFLFGDRFGSTSETERQMRRSEETRCGHRSSGRDCC
uniref:Putative secreted protein n=1 Tax=Ixodes ricinus TaxID=34613 RepID=A0A6B0V351_IXORI